SFGGPPLMGEWWYEGFYQWLKTVPADQRPKKAAIYTMNNPIGLALMNSIYRMTDDLGIKRVIDEKYNLPLPDATPLVMKAKQMGCDLLYANGFFADGVMTIRTAKALNYNPKAIVQGVGSVIPAWVKELGKDGDYVFSGTVLHDKLAYPGNDRLNAFVKKEYNLPGYPLYFGFGYAWMQTLTQGVEGAKGLDQTKIRDWLKSNTVQTIAGSMSFNEKGLPEPINFCTQVINGKVELVSPKNVRTAEPVYPKPAWK
ncbi:MAG: ABC transporter substrate-binding protein, partial [Pseudomonadota bacterium]